MKMKVLPLPGEDRNFTPENVTVDGEKLVITLGDMDTGDGVDYEIADESRIYVVIRQSAGVSNPTEAGTYGPVIEFGDAVDLDFAAPISDVDDDALYPGLELDIPRLVSLDEEDGGRGDEITATGKGFKNGYTITFFLDDLGPIYFDLDGDPDTTDDAETLLTVGNLASYNGPALPKEQTTGTVGDEDDAIFSPNGVMDPGEEPLCDATVGGNDVGTCSFTITNPPFVGGNNYVNAHDGRGGIGAEISDDDQLFILLDSISVTPGGGSPGESLLIQLSDYPRNATVTQVQLSRSDICGGDSGTTCDGGTDVGGNENIKIIIPDWAQEGRQELRVFAGGVWAAETVDISGPVIQATPGDVVANQRVSLIGSGFNARSRIGSCGDECEGSAITIGGEQIGWERINDGNPISVDNGGNWSAAVDMPLTSATTDEGKRIIRVTDSENRAGTETVNIPARSVTITPDFGRVGTTAVVRGANFPSKNDDGDSFNVVVIYDAGNDRQTTVTAVPDASGRFETEIGIPTAAGIPSTNTVKVEFEDANNVKVVTTVTHDVPEGVLTVSQTSGSPGSTVSVHGQGFKAFVPVTSVKVGALEVTPSPRPNTDGQGMLDFVILIPGLDNGIQTIEVQVGGTTASLGFTVTPSGVSAGNITESALATVNLGDNFVRSFNFNNDTKSWTFYSPEAPEASTQTNFITGESYWILIDESQEVILNGKTRNLTCAAGSCWNQIVW